MQTKVATLITFQSSSYKTTGSVAARLLEGEKTRNYETISDWHIVKISIIQVVILVWLLVIININK